MRERRCVSPVQVPGSVLLGGDIETNLRLVIAPLDGIVICRRVEVRSAVWSDDLREKICAALRRRYGLAAKSSPYDQREVLVVHDIQVSAPRIEGSDWSADVRDLHTRKELRFDREPDRSIIADLAERSLVIGFERSSSYWRISTSTRSWYEYRPVRQTEGVEMVPRVSFATIPLGERGIGIAFDFGHLFRTEMTVADFFDLQLDACEQKRRRKRFDELRSRQSGRKGNLLYDIGIGVLQHCYFARFEDNVTCESTGPIQIHSNTYDSLYDYYRIRRPQLEITPSNSVAYVSFPNLPYEKPVAAKLLRLRVTLDKDQMPRELRCTTTMPPHVRREAAIQMWQECGEHMLRLTGCKVAGRLWKPSQTEHERLPCPDLQFGRGRVVRGPEKPTKAGYGRYYHQRVDSLKNGGLYYYEEAVPTNIQLVTPWVPSTWPPELQDAFVQDFTDCIQNVTGRRFEITTICADTHEQIVQQLSRHEPKMAVIIFDDRTTDASAYYLLSHDLHDWRLKRLRRSTVERKWRAWVSARNGEDRREAKHKWDSMILLSVMDTLDQMGAIPWRLDAWPYEACLAIDVGEDRRYFAISILISRHESKQPSFWRATKAWPKADHQREAINPEILRDKIVEMSKEYSASSFSPLKSILALRDGQLRGNEPEAITEALNAWRKQGFLAEDATVDMVDVHKKTVKHLRMWYPHNGSICNVLEGHAVYLDSRTSLVACTGAATLSKDATSEPCILVARNDADIRRVTRAFFALAQLNYSSPPKAHRCAQPLHETDNILKDRRDRDMRGIK